VTLGYGDPIPCPRPASSEEFEKQRRSLEEIMRPGLHHPLPWLRWSPFLGIPADM